MVRMATDCRKRCVRVAVVRRQSDAAPQICELKGSIFAAAKHGEDWNDVFRCNPRRVLTSNSKEMYKVKGAHGRNGALRPTAMNFSMDSTEPSSSRCQLSKKTPSRMSWSTMEQAYFRRFDVTKAGGH